MQNIFLMCAHGHIWESHAVRKQSRTASIFLLRNCLRAVFDDAQSSKEGKSSWCPHEAVCTCSVRWGRHFLPIRPWVSTNRDVAQVGSINEKSQKESIR